MPKTIKPKDSILILRAAATVGKHLRGMLVSAGSSMAAAYQARCNKSIDGALRHAIRLEAAHRKAQADFTSAMKRFEAEKG